LNIHKTTNWQHHLFHLQQTLEDLESSITVGTKSKNLTPEAKFVFDLMLVRALSLLLSTSLAEGKLLQKKVRERP
jgi:hypothetical protein